MGTQFKVSFNNGASVEVVGTDESTYNVMFYDNKTNELIHQDNIRCGYWTKTNRKYYTEWKIIILEHGNIVHTELFNCENKIVRVDMHSTALGDNIAWIPYCEEFRKEHNCDLIVSGKFNDLFQSTYPNIKWVGVSDEIINCYASYNISIGINKNIHSDGIKKLNNYHNKNIPIKYIKGLTFFNPNHHIEHPLLIPLQKVASNILGIEWKEIRPQLINIPDERPMKEKYVCISEFASARGMKEWNNSIGWKTLVSELKKMGYIVVSISKEKTNLKDVVKRNGNYPLSDRQWYLKHCEFFVGLPSGLSWLGWSVGCRVVLIGGFSEKWYEFQENAIRVKNEDVCGGCFNSPKHADKLVCFHESFCPEYKNFECGKRISPKMVIEQIKENFSI